MNTNLFLAIHAEHKARTGHDVFAQGPLRTLPLRCDVCLHLDAVKRAMEQAEAEYYASHDTEVA